MLHRNSLLALMLWGLLSSSIFPTILAFEKTREIPDQIPENVEIDLKHSSYIHPIVVDKRIELLTAVQLFTSWRETGIQKGNYAYKEDMLDFFEPHFDHKAVTLCENLIQSGFAYNVPVMMHLSDPPELRVVTPFSEVHSKTIQTSIERAGGTAVLEEFLEALRSFYLQSDFEEFWDSHQGFFHDVESRAYNDIPLESTIVTLEDYFGSKQHGYHLILAPLFISAYGYRMKANDSFEIYAFYGPTEIEEDMPVFGGFFYDFFVSCFTHPLTDEFLEGYENPARLYEHVTEEMRYGWDWVGMIDTHITMAVTAKLFYGEWFLDYVESMGFIYIRPVFHLLSKYDRDSYPSFREFYPEIVELFNAIADEFFLVVHVVDEKGQGLPNAVVSVFLPNGKEATSKSTNSTGHAVFQNMLNITYSVKASLQGCKEQTERITFRTKEQIETVDLQTIYFVETPLGMATVSGAIVAVIWATTFIILKRREEDVT